MDVVGMRGRMDGKEKKKRRRRRSLSLVVVDLWICMIVLSPADPMQWYGEEKVRVDEKEPTATPHAGLDWSGLDLDCQGRTLLYSSFFSFSFSPHVTSEVLADGRRWGFSG